MLVACSESWVALPVFDDAEDLSEFVEHRAAFRCISMWLEQWPKVVEIVKQPDAAQDNASLGKFADLGVNAECFARSKCCEQDANIASCAQLLNEIYANHIAPVMKMGFATNPASSQFKEHFAACEAVASVLPLRITWIHKRLTSHFAVALVPSFSFKRQGIPPES